MKENNLYKVHIIDEDNIGNGICKIDDFVVFVKNALIDDVLEIKINKIKKRYATAEINKILIPSINRIKPKCKYYKLCGGCSFLHTTYSNERKIKLQYLEKLFNTKVNYLEKSNEFNYRNKVVLHVKNDQIGLYNENTHDICPIDKCLLLDDKINDKIQEIKRFDLSQIKEIMIRVIGNKIMISVTADSNDITIKNIKCDSLYINKKLIKGDKYLIDNVNDFKFSIYPDSFYQVNNSSMIKIYNEVLRLCRSGNSLLDLYCGTGTIGIWVHSKFKKITGVEINKESIKNANINKELNNLNNINFECNDSKNITGKYDTIIVDPPRSGLSLEVIDFINSSKALNVIYVSCNPSTLKRDLDKLYNYEMKEISACDMFPRTKHVESLMVLERRNS